MIVAFAGRRAQSLGGDPERVATRVRELLTRLQPSAVVGAAADGADLLVLEAALSLVTAPTVHVVLPTSRDVFADDSVDEEWRDRFAAALAAVARRGGTIRTLDRTPAEAAYREANQVIIDTAIGLRGGAGESVALVVGREGEGAMVGDFLERAGRAGMPSTRIDPAR